MQAELDRRIKEAGAENAYFPLFIPESFLKLEAEHVEGFAPELAVVTHGGGKVLEEPIVLRPTSETVINHFFSKWVQSHRDLPLLVNQWANVVRWELRPRLFLRTREFLWQEGHTAHATADDARAYALRILDDVYRDTMVEVLRMPVLTGHKTARERFAGATRTWTCEGMMGDGKALQMGTSHELGQNFARPFDITYANDSGSLEYVWQTSWGVSTRLIGGLIMGHGDDFGLRLPPALAPAQVVVLVVKDSPEVGAAAEALAAELTAAGHRVRLDDRTDTGFGRRSVAWELKGVPVRVEDGPPGPGRGERDRGHPAPPGEGERRRGCRRRHGGRHLAAVGPELLAEATAARAPHGGCRVTGGGRRGGGRRLRGVRLGRARPDGEDRLAKHALSIRCLQRPDGALAEPGDAEDDLVPVVAQSYSPRNCYNRFSCPFLKISPSLKRGLRPTLSLAGQRQEDNNRTIERRPK